MIAVYIILGIIAFVLIAMIAIGFIFYNLGLSKRFNPDPLVKYYMPEEFGIDREPVEIKCRRNTLRGFIYNKEAERRDSIVVFVHGMYANVDAYNQEICTIAKRGYEVIALNHVGVDTSTGKKLEGLGGSLKALDYTIRYIKENEEFKNRKIYVVGHSWGGYAALNIRAYHKDIAKIVAISPFVSANRLLLGLLQGGLRIFIPFAIFADICHNGMYCTKNASRVLKENDSNIMVLHSKNDNMVNFEYNTGYLMEKLDNNVEYLISKRNGHNPTYTEEAVEYMREYLDELSCTPASKQDELKNRTDFHKMGELNMDAMNEIINFLNK